MLRLLKDVVVIILLLHRVVNFTGIMLKEPKNGVLGLLLMREKKIILKKHLKNCVKIFNIFEKMKSCSECNGTMIELSAKIPECISYKYFKCVKCGEDNSKYETIAQHCREEEAIKVIPS